MAKSRPMTNADRFKIYNAENPEIYKLFSMYALQLIAIGTMNLSAYLIYERMRWESLVGGNDGYKLNNNYRPYYARLFMQDNPEYEGYFELRRTESEKPA